MIDLMRRGLKNNRSVGGPYPAVSDTLRPDQGGIHPREAADHHKEVAAQLFSGVLEKYELTPEDIGAVAYSQGPGLGPCLRVGAAVARGLATRMDAPLIGVNHCVAHIEIGRQQCGCDDPVLLYVSGGNTQVIARLNGRYRVLGETLDIGIGNMLDKFARNQGIPFPGGPKIEQLANQYLAREPNPDMEGLQLPYAVRGMDLAYSGLLTAAQRLCLVRGSCRTSDGAHREDRAAARRWCCLQSTHADHVRSDGVRPRRVIACAPAHVLHRQRHHDRPPRLARIAKADDCLGSKRN